MKSTGAGLLLSFIALLGVGYVPAAKAAGPEVIITWTADSAVPGTYAGKALPSPGSQVTASVEVLANGGFANLQSRTIYWYLDGSFIGGGTGKQAVSFTAPGSVEIVSLRAQIMNYPGGEIMKTIHIQMANPQVVIPVPYPQGAFSGNTVQLEAVPYFWKTSSLNDLVFQWTVNGESVTAQENPQDLSITLDPSTAAGYQLSASILLQESGNPLASARNQVTLTKAQ